MNDQQLGETPCTVDLSASTLPEQATAEVFTTTIDNNKLNRASMDSASVRRC